MSENDVHPCEQILTGPAVFHADGINVLAPARKQSHNPFVGRWRPLAGVSAVAHYAVPCTALMCQIWQLNLCNDACLLS